MNPNRKNALLLAVLALCVLIPIIVMATRSVNRAIAETTSAVEDHRRALSKMLSYYGETTDPEPLENRR